MNGEVNLPEFAPARAEVESGEIEGDIGNWFG